MNTSLAGPEPERPRGSGLLIGVAVIGSVAVGIGIAIAARYYLPDWDLPLALVFFLMTVGLTTFVGRRLAQSRLPRLDGYAGLVRVLLVMCAFMVCLFSSSGLLSVYVYGLVGDTIWVRLAALLPTGSVVVIQLHYQKAWIRNLRQRAAKEMDELMEQLTPAQRAEVMQEMAAEEEGASQDDDDVMSSL